MSQFLWALGLFWSSAMVALVMLSIREWISPTTMDPGAKVLGLVGLATVAGLVTMVLGLVGLEILVALVTAAVLPILQILALGLT